MRLAMMNETALNSCLAKRRADEPMFVLLGRDPHAPALIEAWANARIALGGDEAEKGYAARMRSMEFSDFKTANPNLGLPLAPLSALDMAKYGSGRDIDWAEDEDGWAAETTGEPGIQLFANALQVWTTLQDHEVSVAEAALAFRCSVKSIREAVEDHFWMYLRGSEADPTAQFIGHDGE